MFDFLNKLSHQHTAQNQPQFNKVEEVLLANSDSNSREFDSIDQKQIKRPAHKQKQKQKDRVSPKQTRPKKQQPLKRQLSLSAQLQQGQTAELATEVLQILTQIRDQSEKRVTPLQHSMLQEQKAKVQRKVYLREMSHNFQEYLEEILLQSSSPNRFVRHGLAEMVDHVANSVYTDVLVTDKYQVVKKAAMTKDQLALLEQSISQIRTKDGSIRQKVGQLKLQLQTQSKKISDKSLQIISKHSFSISHPKTKQTQQFLKNLQQQRTLRKQKHLEQAQQQKQKKMREEYMMEIARQQAKSQRHQRLVQAHQVKRKMRNQEVLASMRKNQEFREWMRVYKNRVPLFREKEKEYVEKFVIPEQEDRFNKLLKRKQAYQPISFDDIQQHEQRYLDYKKDNLIRHKAEIRMQKQAQKRRQQDLDNLHKGQFRYYVLQQMVAKKQAKDPKQALIQKKLKQLAYSQNVKQLHKPKIDPTKQMEMEMMLHSSNKRRKYRNPNRVESSRYLNQNQNHRRSYSYDLQEEEERDPRKEGERNRRYFKEFIREKIQKGEIKKNQVKERSVTIQPRPNYLEQLRSGRQSRIRKAQTIDHQIQTIKKKQDISALLAKVDHHDLKAQRLQQKFKHAVHKPQQQAALQDNYLFSIKAKLELIKNYD